jgi:hypothetical protein
MRIGVCSGWGGSVGDRVVVCVSSDCDRNCDSIISLSTRTQRRRRDQREKLLTSKACLAVGCPLLDVENDIS